jgi:hypothetical protein
MVTHNGYPVEFTFTSGSYSNTVSLEDVSLDLPERARVVGDKAHNRC